MGLHSSLGPPHPAGLPPHNRLPPRPLSPGPHAGCLKPGTVVGALTAEVREQVKDRNRSYFTTEAWVSDAYRSGKGPPFTATNMNTI
jgi:hypothetical protein